MKIIWKPWKLTLAFILSCASLDAVNGEILHALTDSNQILVLDSESPEQIDQIIDIQGIGDESVIGIDHRPATGGLYAVTSNMRVYLLNGNTGEATLLGEDPFASDNSPLGYGWDFNPAVDRIRWVTADATNRRVHPESGSLVATDGLLAYAINDSGFGLDPNIVAVAYDDEANLFGIDVARDQFVSIAPANDGVLHSIGSLGILATRDAGLDVSSASGRIFAAMQAVGNSGSSLYEIQPATGRATLIGSVGDGSQMIVSMTVVPPPPVEPSVYTVSTLSDIVADDGEISLREALMAANTNAAVSDAEAGKPGSDAVDIIRFSDVLADEELILSMGPLIVQDSVVIESPSMNGQTIMADGSHRVFEMAPEVKGVVLTRLNIQNGGGVESGGGILAGAGTEVELQHVNIENCSAADGGGIYIDGGHLVAVGGRIANNVADGPSGSGGGVFTSANGLAHFTDTIFTSNLANRAGGGIEDQSGPGLGLILENVTMMENNAGVSPASPAPGNGGALHITGPGDSAIRGGRIAGNLAAREGGGLWNGSGHMEVSNVVLEQNTGSGDAADDGGGGIFNNGGSMTIMDSSLLGNIADGSAGSGGGLLSLDGMIHMERCLLYSNTANRAGGAIELVDGSLMFVDSQMGGPRSADGNIAGPEGQASPGNGGGLHVTGAAEMTFSGAIIRNNFAAREGGGLWNQSGSTMRITAGTVIVQNSAAGPADHDGGGGVFNNGGTLIIGSSSDQPVIISGNRCTGPNGLGGGLLSIGGPVAIQQLTMADNSTIAQLPFGSEIHTGSGIVQVDSDIQISDSSISDDVLLRNSDGILSGNIGGILFVDGQSSLRSGESPADISVSGFAAGSDSLYEFRLGAANSDRIISNGPVLLGNASVAGLAVDGFSAAPGQVITLIDNRGDVPVRGEFAGQPEGSFMWVGLTTYRLSYVGGDGNDVTLSVSGIPGQVNVAINNTASLNPETGLIEQAVTITNNSDIRQTGIRTMISNLPPGTTLANGNGVQPHGSSGIPFRLLDQSLDSRESAVMTFAFNAPVGLDSVAPTYTVRSREDIVDLRQITQIIPLVNDQALLEFETEDQATYDILYSDDLITWQRSGPVVGQGELTQWMDVGPPVTSTALSESGSRIYQTQKRPDNN